MLGGRSLHPNLVLIINAYVKVSELQGVASGFGFGVRRALRFHGSGFQASAGGRTLG